MKAVAGVFLLLAPLVAAQGGDRPNARTVVARVHAYVDAYLVRLSQVVGEERAEQRLTPAVAPAGMPPRLPGLHTWLADFAVVRSDDGVWLGLRDVYEFRGRPVDQRGALTSRLFGEERAGIGVPARRIADASGQHNLGGRRRNFNTPLFGLALLESGRRDLVRTRAERVARSDGGERWQVRVEERDRPTLVREERGTPVFSSAVFDIDPATGAVLAYEATVGRKDPIRLTCRFARHEMLDMLLPERLEETFSTPDEAFVGVYVYTNWRKFDVTSRVVP